MLLTFVIKIYYQISFSCKSLCPIQVFLLNFLCCVFLVYSHHKLPPSEFPVLYKEIRLGIRGKSYGMKHLYLWLVTEKQKKRHSPNLLTVGGWGIRLPFLQGLCPSPLPCCLIFPNSLWSQVHMSHSWADCAAWVSKPVNLWFWTAAF